MTRRTERLNALLKEVISEVIHREVKNPQVSELITVTRIDITKDLRYAKVYISVIGNDKERQTTLNALKTSAGFISTASSKKVVMRFFPKLTFFLDDSVDKHMRIEQLLKEIQGKEGHDAES